MEPEWTSLNTQKRSKAVSRTVSVGATAAVVVPYDGDRVALSFSVHSGTCFLAIRQEAADNVGIRLTADHGPLLLSLAEHGAIVHGPWSVIRPAGGGTIGIAEVANSEA